MWPYMMYPYGGGFGGFGWLLELAFFLLLAYLIFSLFRRQSPPPFDHGNHDHPHHNPDDPLTVLKRRYAKGEIDRKTFEEMRKDLEK